KPHVYLLHFRQPIGNLANPRGQAQHYIGFSNNLDERIWLHRQGDPASSKLCAHAAKIGIRFIVAEVWQGSFDLEKALKRRKRAADFCPICQQKRRQNQQGLN
ncbi:MAG: hypothetical protein SVX43_21900, partial [Cyanobacteriota bacterium]|nr:hypothetical protein [Cyanobacteriota bacterium]